MTAKAELLEPAADATIAPAAKTLPRPQAVAAEEGVALLDPKSPKRFINREISWLSFNTRVLEEATNPRHPLLERVRFLSISANNLDEFYGVRVAGLRDMVRAGIQTTSDDGLTPQQQLQAIRETGNTLVNKQQNVWAQLRTELRREGIAGIEADELTADEKTWLDQYFIEQVCPVLTPVGDRSGASGPLPGQSRIFWPGRLGRASDGAP